MTILNTIAAYKAEEVAAAKARLDGTSLAAMARDTPRPAGFAKALIEARAAGRRGLICEIKKASPSKGLIRADFDPAALARAYAAGGASCLSVLTDTPSFQGAPDHLRAARTASSCPIIRKDFLLDPYQVIEARAWGASAVLIIMAMVDDSRAAMLFEEAEQWGLDVLIEVHNERELQRALKLPSRLIGINNRDLHSFSVDLRTTERLAPLLPAECLVIAESGITGPDDCARLEAAGVSTFLVGESLMRQSDVETATRVLLG